MIENMDLKQVKELRDLTGASVMDCRNALEEAKGNFEKAQEILKKKGLAIADKKGARETKAGLIEAYIHANGKMGVLVDLRCETDFVAQNPLFKELAHDIALQIAAMAPLYVSPEEIPEDVVKKEKEAYLAELKDSNKPEKIINQIVEGKLQKWYEEVCLLKQPFIKDQDEIVENVVKSYIAKIGENIKVYRFVRFEI
ncbi:MAG: translation elongation factor Ts [Candidatus Pacebacteria bacterium]|nr:translation elongation factor Ts [Candidatus Paceibacterota bacterium]